MTLRVIQWGTGAVGTESLRAILDTDGLELVAVKVFSDDKEGADAGVLAGRDPVGVRATADLDTILTTEADCVAYMPRPARSRRSAPCWPAARTSSPRPSCSTPSASTRATGRHCGQPASQGARPSTAPG